MKIVLNIFLFSLISQLYCLNLKPAIGLLTLPSTFTDYPSEKYNYFGASHAKFLESGGLKVVPINYDLPK